MNNKKAREEKALSKELERLKKEQIRIAERKRKKKQMGGSKDCLQYLILMLDTRNVNSGGHGVAIFKACEALGIQYITKEQPVPFSITWNRLVTSINVSRENQVETVNSEQMEEDVLVLLPVADFVNFVQNHKKGGSELGGGPTLTNYIQTVKQHLPNSFLSFVVIGMEKYIWKDRLQTAFFDDGVSTVKVDKNGQGLLKVWKQQLLQFKNISPDIADAIVQAYRSPHLLMEVIRGAGVLETSRRVGKEMSRRIHTFVTSSNPNEIIK
uniref:ERCC4 domain-containing protein n=1 Tax=Magallana gigas TaxID=29159 RepID=A0A8W8JEU4_MAGGI